MGPPAVQYTSTSDGVSIAWAEAGQGPALLYLGPTPFTHVQEYLAINEAYFEAMTRSFRLIIFDARGTGMSERDVADVSTATLLMDAEAVIGAAKLDRFVVFADLGLLPAWTALHLATALLERVTHIALESPVQNMRELADTPFGRTALALAEADWAVYTQTVFRVLGGWDAADSTWVDPMARAAAGWVDAFVGVQYVRVQETTDLGHLLARVRRPTLVLENDLNAVPARCCQRVAAKIPGAQFRQYSDPNGGQQVELIRAFVGLSSPEPAADVTPTRSGVRTVLFTDLAGSTALTQRLGDAKAQELVRVHDAIVRQALAAAGGSEIKHTGDGIMASFTTASGALECAVAVQRGIAAKGDADLQIHIGLNAGEPVAEGSDLFGTSVQLARRICDHAEAGQILASDVVRQLAAGKGFLFADVGEVVPKGFEEPVRLYELRWREEA